MHSAGVLRWVAAGAVAVIAAVSFPALAADEVKAPIAERVTPEILAEVFPGGTRVGPVDAIRPILPVFGNDIRGVELAEPIGYIFSPFDLIRSPSYSPKPYDAIVGMDRTGVITGIKLLTFYDSYLVGFPDRIERVKEFLAAHIGYNAVTNGPFPMQPDFAQGTTISARSMRAGILDSARLVWRATSGPPITEPTLDLDGFGLRNWDELVALNAISHRQVTFGEMRSLFAAAGAADVTTEVPLGQPEIGLSQGRFDCRFLTNRACTVLPTPIRGDDEIFTDLYFALASPALIGRNVLGSGLYTRYFSPLAPGTQMLAMMSSGPYEFRGLNYLRNEGNQFDRFRLVQGDLEIVFTREQHNLVGIINVRDRPHLPDVAVFYIPPTAGFDALQPFQIILMVNGTTPAGEAITFDIPVAYHVPPEVVLLPYVEPPPAWVQAWQASTRDVTIMGVALLLLTGIFVFQKRLAASPKLHKWVRTGFLVFTLVWIGWIAGGQLSIEHIVNYIRAPFDGVDIGFYLAEPLIVMISVYTLVSLILIGRGVFCGWLCPFGAMQELTSKIGRFFFRLPTWNPSERVQKWLWVPKYATVALVVGVAFGAPEWQATAQEIEPFNTAIGSAFTRPWPYVTYAIILVVMSLFTERFFCRFLCPLGGFLAIADRLHIFTFLKRRVECGSGGCHLCEHSCPVKAIASNGKIIMAECFQCLDCQVEYYDDKRCPPLAQKRKKRERASALPPMGVPFPAMARQASPAMGADK